MVGRLLVAGFVVVCHHLTTDLALGLLAVLRLMLAVVLSVVGSLLFGFRFIRHYIYIVKWLPVFRPVWLENGLKRNWL